jgi:hypothetical protein
MWQLDCRGASHLHHSHSDVSGVLFSRLEVEMTLDTTFEQSTVFLSGIGGYHTYRIPALAVT